MHNLQGRLSLMACPVSGNSIESRAFRNTLPMLSSAHGGQLLRNSTQSILENGLCSVVQGRLLTALLEFLYGLLRKSFSALNSARSALSCIVSVDGLPVGQHPVVCRFLKGAFQQKSPSKRLHGIWDVNQVLRFLKTFTLCLERTITLFPHGEN